jgi:ribosomal protein L13E
MHHIIPIITDQTGKKRRGKGFSLNELKEAGLNTSDTKKLGVHLDRKRKTAHEQNIKTLKVHATKAKSEAKAKPATESTKKAKN